MKNSKNIAVFLVKSGKRNTCDSQTYLLIGNGLLIATRNGCAAHSPDADQQLLAARLAIAAAAMLGSPGTCCYYWGCCSFSKPFLYEIYNYSISNMMKLL